MRRVSTSCVISASRRSATWAAIIRRALGWPAKKPNSGCWAKAFSTAPQVVRPNSRASLLRVASSRLRANSSAAGHGCKPRNNHTPSSQLPSLVSCSRLVTHSVSPGQLSSKVCNSARTSRRCGPASTSSRLSMSSKQRLSRRARCSCGSVSAFIANGSASTSTIAANTSSLLLRPRVGTKYTPCSKRCLAWALRSYT